MRKLFGFAAALFGFAGFAPMLASAHEVYVLSPSQIQEGISTAPFDMIATLQADEHLFMFWAFIAALLVLVVFFVSISRTLEAKLDPLLAKLPPYAPAISRITVGLALLAAAYHKALFGPELPLQTTFGANASLVSGLLYVLGIMLIFGIYTRVAALASMGVFLFEAMMHGVYMLTYANYAAEFILLLLLGGHAAAVHTKHTDRRWAPKWLVRFKERIAPAAFFLLRIGFGVCLLYASAYAKIFHNNLALMVADLPLGHPHSVAYMLGFEPHFLVLGAAIVEIVIAMFFILGVEIRFTSLFLLFWLSLSLIYFGEAVWPHIVLIGIPIAFICYGYDRFSLEGLLFKKGGREPVL